MKFKLLPQKVYSLVLERYLRVETTGFAAPTVEWGVHYTPLPYHIIRRILRRLSVDRADVFVDIGCGKGRVVCCACRLPLRKVVAIEVNEKLLRLAIANGRNVRGKRAEIEALAIPAEEYDYDEATVIYLYNPFGPPVMEKVFAKIDESYRRRPRKLRVAYANCLHEEFLHRTGWLKKCEEWPASKFPGFGCPISFWASDAGGLDDQGGISTNHLVKHCSNLE